MWAEQMTLMDGRVDGELDVRKENIPVVLSFGDIKAYPIHDCGVLAFTSTVGLRMEAGSPVVGDAHELIKF